MKLVDLQVGGFAPATGVYEFTATLAAGNVTAITFTTPILSANATAEGLLSALSAGLAKGQLTSRTNIAAIEEGEVYTINGVNQALIFDPTAYVLPGVEDAVDLTIDAGSVEKTFSEEGGTISIVLNFSCDDDGLPLESMPRVTTVTP